MINVITIDREYGSGSRDIARKLADRLGWKLWDDLLTTEVARLMDCDCRVVEEREERRDSLHYRLFKAFIRGSFEGTVNAQSIKMVDADCIREAAEKVVMAAAREGHCVLVGRGAAYHLQSDPGAFRVFIYAPLQEKVRRLRAEGKSEEEAYQLAESVDRDRAAYIKQYFQLDWPARDVYHLMINSAIGDEPAVETILDSVTLLRKVGTAH